MTSSPSKSEALNFSIMRILSNSDADVKEKNKAVLDYTSSTGLSYNHRLYTPFKYSSCVNPFSSYLDCSAPILLPFQIHRYSFPERLNYSRRLIPHFQLRGFSKRKKPRTSFTKMQISTLEKKFHHQKYLSSNERSIIARSLKMTDAQVKTWFQNRRTKWRRQKSDESADDSVIKVCQAQAKISGED